MGLIAWWKRRRRERLVPEERWIVAVVGDAIRVVDGEGAEASLALADLSAVVIETNDSGPWGADLWWLLFRADGTLGALWPQMATGEREAIDRLMALPGFDHAAVVCAMGSTEPASFVPWRREAEASCTITC